MEKINSEKLDLKSKLNIVRGIIANATKTWNHLKPILRMLKVIVQSLKKDLNSLNNNSIEYLKSH